MTGKEKAARRWTRACERENGLRFRYCVLCGRCNSGPVVPTAAAYRGEQGVICLGCLRAISRLAETKKWERIIAAYENALDRPVSPTSRTTMKEHVNAAFPPPKKKPEAA